ncbi:MAG: cytochrome c oxidase subunit II [Phycisphaerales bacterium]|nr:cytochrome c oxidase subunit II [Phycisphaerales bacterium]
MISLVADIIQLEVLSAIGTTASGGATYWMPEQASEVAPKIDWLFEFINVICYIFFAAILILTVVFSIVYRRRSHTREGEEVTHHTALEVTWTIVPLLIVVVMFYMGMTGYMYLDTVPENAYEVRVNGQVWSWTFQHPNGAVEGDQVTLPMDRPVQFIMTSSDVLHSVFIPAFRVKNDVVPGRYRTLWFTATKPGEFQLLCSEYCGKGHSDMSARVFVLPEEEFQIEIARLAQEYMDLPTEALGYYAADKLYPRCASCHSVNGDPNTGPTFKGLWERTQAGEQRFTNGAVMSQLQKQGDGFYDPDMGGVQNYIRESILYPQKLINEGYGPVMPSFKGQLKDRQVDALIMMLRDLDTYFEADGSVKPAPENLAPPEEAEPEEVQTANQDGGTPEA